MVNQYLTREPRTLNGEKIVCSIKVQGKLDIHILKDKTRPLSYTTHKINLKLIKNLNVTTETMKLLEES